jgi:hypothetical protein
MVDRLAAVAVGPSRHDPGPMAIRYAAPVCEVFAYAPPAEPDPERPWRGYAMYPEDVLRALADERSLRFLATQLAWLGIDAFAFRSTT